MNPRKTYKLIIDNAKKRVEDIKGDWHHIKPRCLGGSDEPRNLVKLTHREHFFCHYLLTKIYPHNSKIHMAYYFMSNVDGKKISARHYEKSREIALEYIASYTGENSKALWESEEKDYKIGNKWVTYKEYMSYVLSKQDKTYMKNEEFQNKCNQTKCLRYMWRYLSQQGIEHLSDEVIRKGWKTRRGFQTNTWKKFFKSFKQWKFELLNYLKENPIDTKYEFSYKGHSKESIDERGRTRTLNNFYTHLMQLDFGTEITKKVILDAKYYYPKGRIWKTVKWKKYYKPKEWINAVVNLIHSKHVKRVKLMIDNQ